MRTISIILCALLCACSQFKYTATSPSGTETVAYTSLGGSSSMETAGGTRLTQNHNKSFGQGAQTATSIAGGISLSVARKSDNAFKATQDTNAAGVATNANNNATSVELAKIAAEAEAAKLAKP